MVANPKHIDNIVTALKGVPTEVVPGLSRVIGDGRVANGLAEAMTEGPDSLAKFLDNVEGGSDLLKNPAFVRISEQLHDAEVAATAASRASREAAQATAPQPVNATTDPAVIAVQARRTMNSMIRELDPSVPLNRLDDAGMQGFADDFIRRMQEVNPQFDGLHRLDERGVQAMNVRMTDAMNATGNTTDGASNFFSRFQDSVNSRFSSPNVNSAPVPDGMQVAVRNGEDVDSAARLSADQQNTNLSTIVDDSAPSPNNNRGGGNGGDEPPVNNGENLGDNVFRGAAGRLPQELMDQAGDIRAALKGGKWFGADAVAKTEKLVEGLRANRGTNTPITEGATTPKEILEAIENGYQPSSQQITDLRGALDNIASGTSSRSLSVRQGFPMVDKPYNAAQIGRMMDDLSPNPLMTPRRGAIALVATTSLSGFILPDGSPLSYPGNTLNGFVGGIDMESMITGRPASETDPIGVMVYKAQYRINGEAFIDDAMAYIEDPEGSGEFLREAVSETASDRIGIGGGGTDEKLASLTDPRSITLYALRSNVSLTDEQQARLTQIESKVDGVIMSKVVQAETAVASGEADLQRELSENDIEQTNRNFKNQGLGQAFSVGIDDGSTPPSTSRQASYSQFAQFYQDTFQSAPSVNLQQQWSQVEASGDGISGLSKQELETLQTRLTSGTEKIMVSEFKNDLN